MAWSRGGRHRGPPPARSAEEEDDLGIDTFYAPDATGSEPGDAVVLDADEARHVAALRLRSGDELRLTDGRGGAWRARLREAGDERAVCEVLEPADSPTPLPVQLAFGVGAKDRTLWLVEKAVELGAVALQPVEVRRSRSVADAARSRAFWGKASRRAVAALKQCGGARLPEIGPVRDLHDLLDDPGRPEPGGGWSRAGPDVLLEGSAGRPLSGALEGWTGEQTLRLLLGPEGGLTEAESEACLRAGFVPASLGPRRLRFETAGLAGLAVAAQRAPGAWRGRAAGQEGDPRVGGPGGQVHTREVTDG